MFTEHGTRAASVLGHGIRTVTTSVGITHMHRNVLKCTRDQDMISAAISPSQQDNSNRTRPYATSDDFEQLFLTEITDLFRLSLQLTADAEKAERCLVHAMRDCFGGSIISRHFMSVWARRMVIRNAIQLVLGIDNDLASDAGSELQLQPSEYRIEELRESVEILDLPDLDRLVFVICVLERLSVLDCALLLKRSPKDVCEGIARAANRVALAEGLNPTGTTTGCRTIAF